MSRYKLEELCFSLAESANAARFKADPEAYMAEYALTDAEKEALRAGDVGAMYKMGMITQAILSFARVFGYDNATYVSNLREAAGLPEIKEQTDILRKR